MQIDIRVRGICITPENRLVIIRREKTGQSTYRVFPGGGIEKSDRTPTAALHRELSEELGARAEIGNVIFVVSRKLADGRSQEEWFYICKLISWSTTGGTGPEWTTGDTKSYAVEEIPLDASFLANSNIKPEEVGKFVADNLNKLHEVAGLRSDGDYVRLMQE